MKNKKEITLEQIEKEMGDLFYGKSYPKMREAKTPYIRQLSDGSWEIFSGEEILRCNGAGKAMFDKAIQEQMSKLTNGK